jgi:hypothetical protein
MDRIDWGSPFVSDLKIRKSLYSDGIDQNGLSSFFVNKTTSSLRGFIGLIRCKQWCQRKV